MKQRKHPRKFSVKLSDDVGCTLEPSDLDGIQAYSVKGDYLHLWYSENFQRPFRYLQGQQRMKINIARLERLGIMEKATVLK